MAIRSKLRSSPALHATLPLLVAGAGLLAVPARAAEPEPLDEEFLEYLAQLEGDEDDWTLFEAEAKPAPVQPAASKPTAAKEPVAKPPPSKVPAEVKR